MVNYLPVFEPHQAIYNSTSNLIHQRKTGSVRYSFSLTPFTESGDINNYLEYCTHLTDCGLIMEAKINEELYQTQKNLGKISDVSSKVFGYDNPTSKGMSHTRNKIISESWNQALQAEDSLYIPYEDINYFLLRTPFLRAATLEFGLSNGTVLSFLPSIVNGRDSGGFSRFKDVGEAFVNLASFLKEASSKEEVVFKPKFGFGFWVQWILTTFICVIFSATAYWLLESYSYSTEEGRTLSEGTTGLIYIILLSGSIGFGQWLMIRSRASINICWIVATSGATFLAIILAHITSVSINSVAGFATFGTSLTVVMLLLIRRSLNRFNSFI